MQALPFNPENNIDEQAQSPQTPLNDNLVYDWFDALFGGGMVTFCYSKSGELLEIHGEDAEIKCLQNLIKLGGYYYYGHLITYPPSREELLHCLDGQCLKVL